MTLLLTIFAAVVSTLVWYTSEKARAMKIGILNWMFWGASLMWLGDAIFGFAEDGAAYFTPAAEEMLNDAFLGLAVIALALVIWVVCILVSDPKGVVRNRLRNRKAV